MEKLGAASAENNGLFYSVEIYLCHLQISYNYTVYKQCKHN